MGKALELTASIPPATDTDISQVPVVLVPMDQATPAGIPAGSSHAFVHRTCLNFYSSEFGGTFPVVSSNSTWNRRHRVIRTCEGARCSWG